MLFKYYTLEGYKILHSGCISRVRKWNFLIFLLIVVFFMIYLSNSLTASDATYAVSISIVEEGVFEPGEAFHCITEIRNSQASGRVDVVLSYEILDESGALKNTKSTTVAVETLSSFSEEIKIPETLTDGIYVLKASVVSLDGVNYAETSVSFNVVRVVTEGEQRIIEFIMGGAIIVTVIALVFEHRRVSKLKVSGSDLKRFVIEKKK